MYQVLTHQTLFLQEPSEIWLWMYLFNRWGSWNSGTQKVTKWRPEPRSLSIRSCFIPDYLQHSWCIYPTVLERLLHWLRFTPGLTCPISREISTGRQSHGSLALSPPPPILSHTVLLPGLNLANRNESLSSGPSRRYWEKRDRGFV